MNINKVGTVRHCKPALFIAFSRRFAVMQRIIESIRESIVLTLRLHHDGCDDRAGTLSLSGLNPEQVKQVLTISIILWKL